MPYRQAFDILEYEISRSEFPDQSNIVRHQLIARIVERSIPDEAEPLTWRTTDNGSNLGSSDSRIRPDVLSVNLGDVPTYRRTVREIEFVDSAVNRVVLDYCTNIEPCLLETEAKTACPSEQIDDDRVCHVIENLNGSHVWAQL